METMICLKLPLHEKDKWKWKAREAGLSLSEWVKACVKAAGRRRDVDADMPIVRISVSVEEKTKWAEMARSVGLTLSGLIKQRMAMEIKLPPAEPGLAEVLANMKPDGVVPPYTAMAIAKRLMDEEKAKNKAKILATIVNNGDVRPAKSGLPMDWKPKSPKPVVSDPDNPYPGAKIPSTVEEAIAQVKAIDALFDETGVSVWRLGDRVTWAWPSGRQFSGVIVEIVGECGVCVETQYGDGAASFHWFTSQVELSHLKRVDDAPNMG